MTKTAITMGDAAGVGPEIILKAMKAQPQYQEQCVVFGAAKVLRYYNEKWRMGLTLREIDSCKEAAAGCVNVIDPFPIAMEEFTVGQLSARCGDGAYRYLEAAVQNAMAGEVSAVVTAPLNKEALHMGGHMFAGHTEILAALTGVKSYAMLLWSESLKVIHVSTHVSLRRACDLATKERVAQVIRLGDRVLKKAGLALPRIAVAGLNPHAGEHGLFGEEEQTQLIPAIKECRAEGIDVTGPEAPDTVFLKGSRGTYDLVVAMYHDQGHIPLKLLDFKKGVNMTVGLPVIRTSVDHGTAFDIAGTGQADETSLLEALQIAVQLA
ncbi:MAG: 4-hydroxythreonine-4-phosphate dehydrogenase PdxA [Lachnospiraceae bacterium]|nr:4-hydroxythreonine-4-phosphate dehydrogenase PdxA [Lachnospiraceae bacterium]